MFYIVYKIVNCVNGKYYIGVHKTENLNDGYMGSGKLIKEAISKFGIECFTKEILHVFDNSEEMFAKEIELIVVSPETYNMKEGGFGGWDHISEYTERNRKISSQRNYQDPVFIERLSKATSKANKKRIANGEKMFGGKRGDFSGKKHSEETKQKMREAAKGRIPWNKGKHIKFPNGVE